MNVELTKLQSQLDLLTSEFRAAQGKIYKLEKRSAWRRPNVATLVILIAATALCISSWSAKASSGNERPGPNATDVATKVKAPFEVDDNNGNPIMIVRDQGGDATIDRGVYVFNESHKAVIDLSSTSDDGGGGMIKVTDAGVAATSVGSEINGVEIGGTQKKTGIQIVRGGKKLASIGAEQGDKFAKNSTDLVETGGMIQIYDSSEKPAVTLLSGKTGGELDVFGAKPKPTSIGGSETSGGSIKLFGTTDKPIAVLGGTQSGGGSLSIYGTTDKPKAVLGSEADGGSLKIFGSSDTALATLATNAGNGKLSIGNKGGIALADVFADENGGQLKMYRSSGQGSATIQTLSSGSSMNVYGSTDKPVATLGTKGDDGMVSVFGSGDKLAATLQSDAGDGKLWISDKSGKTVAGVFATDNGGVVKVMKNGDPTTYTSMSAINAGMGLAVRVAGIRKSYVGTNSEGNGGVYVYGHGDNPAAVLTTIKGGKGLIAVFNDLAAIAMLAESDKHPGGGEVSVTDPDGNGVFAAGYAGDGGEACVNRKSGLKCLGVGLPLQINE